MLARRVCLAQLWTHAARAYASGSATPATGWPSHRTAAHAAHPVVLLQALPLGSLASTPGSLLSQAALEALALALRVRQGGLACARSCASGNTLCRQPKIDDCSQLGKNAAVCKATTAAASLRGLPSNLARHIASTLRTAPTGLKVQHCHQRAAVTSSPGMKPACLLAESRLRQPGPGARSPRWPRCCCTCCAAVHTRPPAPAR